MHGDHFLVSPVSLHPLTSSIVISCSQALAIERSSLCSSATKLSPSRRTNITGQANTPHRDVAAFFEDRFDVGVIHEMGGAGAWGDCQLAGSESCSINVEALSGEGRNPSER